MKQLLIILTIVSLFACKKQNTTIQNTNNNVVTSVLSGNYKEFGGDIQIRDTIHIYSVNNVYYMTCADVNTSTSGDTIQINLINDTDFNIPKQMVYGNTYYNQGSGYVANGKLYINFTSPMYTKSCVFNKY